MKNKRMIALLLLLVMVLAPIASAFAIEVEVETEGKAEETVEANPSAVVAHCEKEYAAIEAAHKVRVAAAADASAKKEAAIASIARYNEAKSELARAKVALDRAESQLVAAKETQDAENIKDAAWCVSRDKAVFDKWAAAVVTTKAAMAAAEAAWKAAVSAYETAVAAENSAIRAYNRCAASNLPLVSVDPSLVAPVAAPVAALPVAGALR